MTDTGGGPTATRRFLARAQEVIGVTFESDMLLSLALTHRSYSHESLPDQHINNEKLEFLGDSVLNFVITTTIFDEFSLSEGDMAKLRANLVNEEILAGIAHDIGLGECVMLGKGAERTGGRARASILSDTYEAVVGALYLDQGFDAAHRFVLTSFGDTIREQASADMLSDYKSALQEVIAKELGKAPSYRVVREDGPDHDRTFHSEILIDGRCIGAGSGKSKKKAEQEAARRALEKLSEGNAAGRKKE